ncbi:MAG TPA: NAD(P)H-dependent oxidoreductase [Solirubrobacteraceae bacterium]|nr:NAD(P)H-dependent oxidoreductase [Solirubrobacteraceae bacterium]
MKVLGISGSLRRDSHNTKLLRTVGEMFEAAGVEFEIYPDLKLVPPYDEDDDVDQAPAAAAQLRAAVAGADAVFFSTPEYNSSIPGQLKNAIDWLSRPKSESVLLNKPVAVIGASTGMFGAVWAQAELRKTLAASGARVVEGEVAVGHAHTRFDDSDRLSDPDLSDQVAAVVQTLIGEAAPRRTARAAA